MSLDYVMVNVFLAEVCVPLLLILFIILRQTNVLTVSNLVLSIIWLEVVENILAKLQINVYWYLVCVT